MSSAKPSLVQLLTLVLIFCIRVFTRFYAPLVLVGLCILLILKALGGKATYLQILRIAGALGVFYLIFVGSCVVYVVALHLIGKDLDREE